jgi:hypothetical protein
MLNVQESQPKTDVICALCIVQEPQLKSDVMLNVTSDRKENRRVWTNDYILCFKEHCESILNFYVCDVIQWWKFTINFVWKGESFVFENNNK